jgi:GMP reductase
LIAPIPSSPANSAALGPISRIKQKNRPFDTKHAWLDVSLRRRTSGVESATGSRMRAPVFFCLQDSPTMEIFDYDNILLLPRKCRVDSRGECDPSLEFGGRRFTLPVVPANMKTVIDESIAESLARSDHFYVMHRFDLDNVAFATRMRKAGLFVSISSGVKASDHAVIDRLAADGVGADYITIDIAHGHAESVRRTIEHIKKRLPKTFVIAGNVGTPEGVIDLENWGADATKVGIGPGKVCITLLKTGFGTGGWQLSALKWCARVATKPIVADGGIRHHGDIAKSVRFGAAMVMIGSLFAGHEESPGETVEVDGKLYKEYYGSASDFNKGEYKHVEGKRILEPIKGKLADTLREMREDLQSSISYAGGRALADLRKVNYVILGGENAGEHLFM